VDRRSGWRPTRTSTIRSRSRSREGRPPPESLGQAEWLAEAAAFTFDFDLDPESIARWSEEVSLIPPEELNAMIHAPNPEDDLSPRALLAHAAFFADTSMCYHGMRPKESIESYRLFLCAPLLREIVGNPFRSVPHRVPS
jgi:hypothetical protein